LIECLAGAGGFDPPYGGIKICHRRGAGCCKAENPSRLISLLPFPYQFQAEPCFQLFPYQ
jgi:hypothetical protein